MPPRLTVAVTPARLEDAHPPWPDTVRCPSAGAVATFVGTTRDSFQGKPTLRLEYEAYVPMAEAELKVTTRREREKPPTTRSKKPKKSFAPS